MNHTMKLTIRRVEGAMIRALGLIERRGFAVTSITSSSRRCGKSRNGATRPPGRWPRTSSR